MSRKLNSWRLAELGLTAFGWDGLSDMSPNPLPNHRSKLFGLVQCWQKRQCVAQPLWTGCLDPKEPTGLGMVSATFCHALRQ